MVWWNTSLENFDWDKSTTLKTTESTMKNRGIHLKGLTNPLPLKIRSHVTHRVYTFVFYAETDTCWLYRPEEEDCKIKMVSIRKDE
mgnify:CR=1 FL=1